MSIEEKETIVNSLKVLCDLLVNFRLWTVCDEKGEKKDEKTLNFSKKQEFHVKNEKSQIILVTYLNHTTINVQLLKQFCRGTIFVIPKKSLSENKVDRAYEFFTVDELLINIFRMDMVPRHELIHDPRILNKLESRYGMLDKLPRISLHELPVRFLGGRVGEVVRISRKDNQGEYYRVIMDIAIEQNGARKTRKVGKKKTCSEDSDIEEEQQQQEDELEKTEEGEIED